MNLYVCVECGTLGPRDRIRGNCGGRNAHGRLVRVRKWSGVTLKTWDTPPKPLERCIVDDTPVVECEMCAVDGACVERWGSQ